MAKSTKKKGAVASDAHMSINEGLKPQIPAAKLQNFEGSGHPWLWVRKCETFFSLYRIPISQRVNFASLHLRGKAEIWFDCMMQERMKQLKGDFDWDDFAQELCERFGVAENLSLLKQFKALNQYSTSVQEYHDIFEELLSLVMSMFPWYDCNQIVTRYIAGLTIAIRRQVQKHNPTTLARAFRLAKLYESPDDVSNYSQSEEEGETIAVISPQAIGLKDMDENGKPVVYIQSLKPTTRMATWIAHGVTLPSKRPMTISYDSWSTHSFIDAKLVEECGFTAKKADPVTICTDLGKRRVISDSVCRGFTWELDGQTSVMDMRVLKLEGELDMILGTDIHGICKMWSLGCGDGYPRATFTLKN